MTAIVERLVTCQPPHSPTPRPPPARGPINRAVWLGFLVVIASSVMDLLDSTIAQTAAPGDPP